MSKPSILPVDFNFLEAVPDWHLASSGQEISREFTFKNFKSAFAFMTLSADFAEELNHHPDWTNCWNKVSVRLSTHDLKGLTKLDITMACAMDQFARDIANQN
jgi:4a-hydroxytetrahydrobiopterin dehydratase